MNHHLNLQSQGPPRCFPRPFFDVFRPHFRAPDEPSGLVGGLRRDVAPPYWPPISLAPPYPHPGPMGMLPGPMAQDEEGDFMLGEKLLKKPKRIRTRVDAGEPRNPYSAFGTFPNLCGVNVNSVRPGGVTNGLFSGSPTLCGLPFVNYLNPPNGFGTRGMLSELFGVGQTKPMISCPTEERNMGVLDKVNSNNVHSSDSLNSVIRGPEADNVLLREILQGRKRELLTMEDIEAARSLHNNNIGYKSDRSSGERDEMTSRDGGRRTSSVNALTASEDEARCDSDVDDALSPRPLSPASDSDPKKNRLENIVSVIRSSPTPPTPVNGCKKRKLYLPQQHESRTQVGSPDCSPVSPHEPEIKSRRVEEGPSSPSRQENSEDDRGLQIDLTVRSGERNRHSPVCSTPRPSSTKPLPPPPSGTLSGRDTAEASAYLLDYAKHLFRSQSLQREMDSKPPNDLGEKLQLLRSFSLNSQVTDLIEGLADVLKTEITASLAVIIDSIVNKYVQQRKMLTKQAEAAAEQLNRDIASQLMERSRSPRLNNLNLNLNHHHNNNNNNNNHNFNKERNISHAPMPRINGMPPTSNGPLNLTPSYAPSENNLNSINLPHLRPHLYKSGHGFFHGSLPPTTTTVPLGQTSPYASLAPEPEQDEALSLVVTPKKKRHKVTDSRLTPRTVGRLLEDLPRYPHMPSLGGGSISPRGSPPPNPHSLMHSQPPPRPSYPQPPPPLLPVSLPTSVAIPNPSLHDTSLLYPSYYRGAPSPPESRRVDSPPSHPAQHHHPLIHPALLAASSPDSFSHLFRGADHDRGSDCSPADNHYDGVQPAISFYSEHAQWNKRELMFGFAPSDMSLSHSSTLTPMHLRKAKLMFFFVRYPSSSVLKTFFPDIKFNKNNTAQLVKWFSNFREFYYIQMEKYARQAISEGVKSTDEITVTLDSELIRVLNLHYNRNNHLEIPEHFRHVAEQTLREFYKALQEGKDTEQSWKKAIYKIIARMDESVPEYFKSPSFLDQLE